MNKTVIDSPIGKIAVFAENEKLIRLDLKTKERADSVITEKVLFEAEKQLFEYFSGKRKKPRASNAQDHPLKICSYQTARLTLPDLRQLVHTEAFLTLPLSLILTVWILAFHFLFVWMLE